MPSWSNRWRLLSYVILIVMLILGCLVTPVLFRTAWRWGKVSEATFNKIQLGMTEQDVEAILGRPAEPPGNLSYMTIGSVRHLRFWSGWHNSIVIGLDEDGRVALKDFHYPGKMLSVFRDENGRIWSYSSSTNERVEVRPNP